MSAESMRMEHMKHMEKIRKENIEQKKKERRGLSAVAGRIGCAGLLLLLCLLLLYNGYMLFARYVLGDPMPTVFGYCMAGVVSGSMEPEIRVGDLIVTRSQVTYAQGDIILFYEPGSGSYITHRILLSSGGQYVTKGDANDTEDRFRVTDASVVGKVVAVCPGFGYVVGFLQSPLGMLTVLGGGFLVMAAVDFLTEVARHRKQKEETGSGEGERS